MNPIDLYVEALSRGLRPALLLTPREISLNSGLSVLGIAPSQEISVREGKLYIDGKLSGSACELLHHLNFRTHKRGGFFPAFVGFCTYEFSRHFGLVTHLPVENLPEATFYLYEQGFVWRDGQLIEQPERFEFEKKKISLSIPFAKVFSSTSDAEFLTGVKKIQNYIRAGHVYQVNLSRRYEFDATQFSPISLLNAMSLINPSPFMGLIEGDKWAVLSGSPERLFNIVDGVVSARPIAGTRSRGNDTDSDVLFENELLHDPKELAEHAMLVDLLRNDLAQISESSVVLQEYLTVERYSHVMHLVSELSARTTASLGQIFRSIFPGGTITGAPKKTVMEVIAEVEAVPRGAYTGTMGYVSQGYGTDFNILIRSCFFAEKRGYFSAGAGIVIDSDPQRELQETKQKAKSFRVLLSQSEKILAAPEKLSLQKITRLTTRKSLVKNQVIKTAFSGLNPHVLFIENKDSFSYNIVECLKLAGCLVEVQSSVEKVVPKSRSITHVIIGPGPGDPRSNPNILELVEWCLEQNMPLLGICLGHQALGVICGASLQRNTPIHGHAHEIFHNDHELFVDIPNPSKFARYHSLVLSDLIFPLKIIGWLEDNSVMAIAHENNRAFGVQFHPESFLSHHGIKLINNFLKIKK